MARARLSYEELCGAVRSSEVIGAQSFKVAASLADEYGRSGDVSTFRSLLLTALEHRDAFGGASEIIDSLIREIGLFPYLDPESLDLKDRFAYEVHKPDHFPLENVVFHGPQARVYWELMRGRNVILSAPTSFGKSLVIDAIVGSQKFDNILIVVPTIALIDETRRRLSSYDTPYKIIAHPSQEPATKNVYVLTQERVLDLKSLESIDFFVIDEFYKLSPGAGDSSRSALLNLVFHKLSTAGKQFYLLGPDIEGVSPEISKRMQATFVYEPYQTVASEAHEVAYKKGSEFEALRKLCETLVGPTLVFCSSPGRASKILNELLASPSTQASNLVEMAADWIADNYHADWHFSRAMRKRVGIHHGRIPRALAHFVVMLFNRGELKQLVCTSTLIEGVNTRARNIVVFDNKIDRTLIDFFTFNNICGRSGRMFQHFVGHVYLFHPAPERRLPFVDVPAFSQSDGATEGLLLQLDDAELTDQSRDRLAKFTSNEFISIEVLKMHPDAQPEHLVSLAIAIEANLQRSARLLRWTYDPDYEELVFACDLIWKHLNGAKLGSRSVVSASQLATKIFKLRAQPSTREQILAELEWSKDIDVDEAVRRVLDFNRLWVSFHFPRLLMIIQSVAHHVLKRHELKLGDFSAFAARVESFFLSPLVSPLDEYGIPIEVTRKVLRYIEGRDLDTALEILASLDLAKVPDLHPFELFLLRDAVSGYKTTHRLTVE